MTIDDFCESLSELRYHNWRVGATGKIRAFDTDDAAWYCPITAVACHYGHGRFTVGKYREASRAIGMDKDMAIDIVSSADNDSICGMNYRPKILGALGLANDY